MKRLRGSNYIYALESAEPESTSGTESLLMARAGSPGCACQTVPAARCLVGIIGTPVAQQQVDSQWRGFRRKTFRGPGDGPDGKGRKFWRKRANTASGKVRAPAPF